MVGLLGNSCNFDDDDDDAESDEKAMIVEIALTDQSITADRLFPAICFLSDWRSTCSSRLAFRAPAYDIIKLFLFVFLSVPLL